jgi:hypothetical protein
LFPFSSPQNSLRIDSLNLMPNSRVPFIIP